MFAKRLVLNIENQLVEINQSHPSWMRGLKLSTTALFVFSGKSHPSWMRGLKQ